MKLIHITALALALPGLTGKLTAQTPPAPTMPQASGEDFLAADVNPSADPAKDFFAYANGGWLARHPIPASESGWGIGDVVKEDLYEKLRSVDEQAAAAHAPAGSDQQKLGDFWTTAMDETKADAQGISPLQPPLALIDSIKTVNNVIDAAFALRPVGADAFFRLSVRQDEKQSDTMSVHLGQGGLGLPDRDFYFNPEKGIVHIRQEYEMHLARLLELLGRPKSDALAAAGNVMQFETALAEASRKLADLRDPQKNYNKMSPATLTADHIPLIVWDYRLAALSLHSDAVIVGQPEFFTALNGLLTKTPLPVLQDYLRLQLVSGYAKYLGRPWADEDFAFSGQVLGGQKEQRARWKRVLDSQNSAMGMMLGKIFVQAYFPPQAKQRYTALVEAIRTAYGERIDRLAWMSDATKTKAREKLAKVTPKVGYPDHWKDYSALVIGTNSYCENMMNAARWRFQDMVSKYGKPVDRTEWRMTPQTYNASYSPSDNQITLPAAIFAVPGMRDEDLDDAFVYGYAGAGTIGHEITHGFDDEGRQFDAVGNLKDWWTAEDAARFQKRAQVMADQFDAYEPIPGLHINGRASLGENLADYGGLMLGLDALKKTGQYKQGTKIGGYTPIQRFFLGYAYGWMEQQREENLRRRLLSDVHAPAKWRVNGPFSNIPEFYEAFGIKPGDPMWRPAGSHVEVW